MNVQAIIYVVDDDSAMRRSTCLVLEAAGLDYEAFESAQAFLDSYRRGSPGCLILDLHMPGMGGMELIQKLAELQVKLPVIVLSGTGTIPTAVQGMKMGVKDFLEKPIHPNVLLEKVHAALATDAAWRAEDAELQVLRQRFATLTTRENEVLQLVVDGLPNKLIARRMDISIKTVTNHRANLIEKVAAVNTADLVRMFMLVKPAFGPTTATRPAARPESDASESNSAESGFSVHLNEV